MGRDLTNTVPHWRCVGACLRGRQHAHLGGRCEDAWAMRRFVNGTGLAVCISDGAGTAPWGYLGARLVCRFAVRWLEENRDRAFSLPLPHLRCAFSRYLRAWLSRLADKKQAPMQDFACTVAALLVDSERGWVVFHVGDGAVVGLLNQMTGVVSLPMKGEFANQTVFLTDEDAPQSLAVYRGDLPSGDDAYGFLLFTDGLEGSLVNRRTGEVANAATKLIRWLHTHDETTIRLLIENSLQNLFCHLTDDDCTIVILAHGR